MWCEESVMGNNTSSSGSGTRFKPVEGRKNSTSEDLKQSAVSSRQNGEVTVQKYETNLQTGPVMSNFRSSNPERTLPTKQSYVQQLFDARKKDKMNESKKTVPISRYLPLFTVHFASIALRNNNRVKQSRTIPPRNVTEEVKIKELSIENIANEKEKRQSEKPSVRRIFIENKAKSADCVRINKAHNLTHDFAENKVKFVSPLNTKSQEKAQASEQRKNSLQFLKPDFLSHLGKYSPQTSRENLKFVENKGSSNNRGTYYENKWNSPHVKDDMQSKLKSNEDFINLKNYCQVANKSCNTSAVQSQFDEFTNFRQNCNSGNLDLNMCMFSTIEPNYGISFYTDISEEYSPTVFNRSNDNSKPPMSSNLDKTCKNKKQFQKNSARGENNHVMKAKSFEPERYESSSSKPTNVRVMTELDKLSKQCNSSAKSSAYELANTDWLPEQYKIENISDLSELQYPRETRQAFILMISDIKTELKDEKFNALSKEIDGKIKCKEIVEEKINTNTNKQPYNLCAHNAKTYTNLKDQNLFDKNGNKKDSQQTEKNVMNLKTSKNLENRCSDVRREECKAKENVKYNGRVGYNNSVKRERFSHGYGDISDRFVPRLSTIHERNPNICKTHSSSYIESSSSLSTDVSYYRVQKLFQSMISENKNGKLRRFRRNISGYKEMDRLGLGTWDKKRWTPSDSKAYTILNEFQKNVTGFQGNIKCKRK